MYVRQPSVRMHLGIGGNRIFTPTSLFSAGEQGAWYDPSDLSTMFQDTAGTVPVTATGQSVARINDKSGRGNHATQATGASQPTLQNDGVNNYLLFDGINDFLATSAIDLSATDEITACLGIRKLSDAATFVALENTLGNGSFRLFNFAGSAGWTFGNKGTVSSDAASPASYPAPDTRVLTGLAKIASDTNLLRLNGTQVLSAVVDQGTGNMGNYPLYIGRRGGTSLPFNGRIYQLVVRNVLTGGGDLANLEAFVNGKTAAY